MRERLFKMGLLLLILGANVTVWYLVQKRLMERQLQSESPENEQASFLMEYFLPIFQIEPDQVTQVEQLEQTRGEKYFLPGSKKFVRGLRLIPLVLGNRHHPAGLSCEIYGLSPAGQRSVEIHIHRCVLGVRLAELHEDESHHTVKSQHKPSPDGGGGLLATAKIIGLGARVHFDESGRIDEFRVLDEDMTVFLKIERIPDERVLTVDDVHAKMVATATKLSRENMGQMSIESELITVILNTSFLKRYYFDLKDMALGLIQQNILAGLTGPMGVGGTQTVATRSQQVPLPQDQLRPDALTTGLPQSVAQSFGYVRETSRPTPPPDEAPTQHFMRYLAKPEADVRQMWIEEARADPAAIFDQFVEVLTNTTSPTFNQEVVSMLLEINTENADKLLSYLLGGTNDLGFRQLSHPLLGRTLQSLVALQDLSEPAADVMIRAWLDRNRPQEIRQAIADRFDELDFHGQRVIALALERKLKDSRASVFEKVDALALLGQLPFNQDHLEIITPYLSDRQAVIQKAAIRAVAGFGDAGYEQLRDLLLAPQELATAMRQEVLDALVRTGTRGARLVKEMSLPSNPLGVIRMVSPTTLPAALSDQEQAALRIWDRDQRLAVEVAARHVEELRRRFSAAQSFEEKSSILYDSAQVSATPFLVDVIKNQAENIEVRKRAFLIFNYPDLYRAHDEWDASRYAHYLAILDLDVPFFTQEIKNVLVPEAREYELRAKKHPRERIEHFRRMWHLARGDLIRQLAGDNAYLRTLAEQRLARLEVRWPTVVDEILAAETPLNCVPGGQRSTRETSQDEWSYAYRYVQRIATESREDAQEAQTYLPKFMALQACAQNPGGGS